MIVRDLVCGLYYGARDTRPDRSVYDTCAYHPDRPGGELGGTNYTLCHVDVPIRNCSLVLDGEPIVVDGDIVVEAMRAELAVKA